MALLLLRHKNHKTHRFNSQLTGFWVSDRLTNDHKYWSAVPAKQITHIFPLFGIRLALKSSTHLFQGLCSSLVLLLRFYLCVLLLFVLLQIWPGHWLLADITQCDVPSTVDLVGSKISLWDVMFAKKGKENYENMFTPPYKIDWSLNIPNSYLPIATELCIFICHGFTKVCGQSVTF